MKVVDRLSNKCFSSETDRELENISTFGDTSYPDSVTDSDPPQAPSAECAGRPVPEGEGLPAAGRACGSVSDLQGEPASPSACPGPGRSRHLLIKCDQTQEVYKDYLPVLSSIWDNPAMNPYYDDVLPFMNWLQKTMDVRIVIKGYTHYPHGRHEDIEPFTEFEYSKKVATRYSYDYVKILLSRCYKFQDWIKGRPCVMGAFTVPHEYNKFGELKNPGMNHMACLSLIKKGWRKFRWRLHKRYGYAIPYVFLFEAHEMGYPHFHAVLVGDFSESELTWMQKSWSDCTNNSQNWEYALKFSDLRELEYPVAYLLKYLYKTLWQNCKDWAPEDWLLNALLWKTGTRSFQPSNTLQEIMKPDPKEDLDDKVYTHILASGIPRKGGENEDLPVVIALPKAANDEYISDALRNPHCAPYIPLKARSDCPELIPAAIRAKRWIENNCDTKTTWKGWKPVKQVLPSWQYRKDVG